MILGDSHYCAKECSENGCCYPKCEFSPKCESAEEQNKKLANQLEDQEKRLNEQEKRLKNQGSFASSYDIDEILAKAEERKQEQARKLEEQRNKKRRYRNTYK